MVRTILIVAQARDPREHGDGQNRRRADVAPMRAKGRE